MFNDQSRGSSSIIGRYRIIEHIGEGKHGVVLKAIDQEGTPVGGDSNTSPKYVAIKKIVLRTRKDEVSLNAVREIKVLQCCDHPNIISLIDMYPDLCGMALVFDYMPFTLFTRIKDGRPLDVRMCRSYMGQLLDGLTYMHAKYIMHRDIKPANLLIDNNDCLKIADFGLSRLFEPQLDRTEDDKNDDRRSCYSPQVASRWYRPPELLWGSPNYGPAIDSWAAGCVLAEMLRGEPLFKASTDIEQLALVIQVLGTPTVDEWPELESLPDYKKIRFPPAKGTPWCEQFPGTAKTPASAIDLVAGLVVHNPLSRLSAAKAREHVFFNE